MTDLQLYNSLTKQKEVFTPMHPGKAGMYTCGPTVYDFMTIGNFRSYVTADTLHRYLKYSGYEVHFIKNITDVGHLTEDDIAQGDSGEDKMLKKARLEKKDPFEIARFYENAVKEDEKELNILPPQYAPRATEHIPHMIAMIEKLIERDCAYNINGNVFMDVQKFENYGQLSGNTLENLSIGARLSDPHPDKKNQWDFALWLKAPENHLMQWDSPWSRGYPGWHIECSAMSAEYLGDQFDLHTGGEDNIFPHHEAEIAQTETVTEKRFVNYWVHTRHLLVNGERMGKSKGNAFVLEDIKKEGFDAMDLRMIYLLSHYRSQMNFTWETLTQAQKNRQSILAFYSRISEESSSEHTLSLPEFHKAFEEAMNDDLNTPQALAVILKLITEGNKMLDADGLSNTREIKSFLEKTVGAVFGISLKVTQAVIPEEVTALAEERQKARAEKDFALSDSLREQISEKGYIVEDTADGFTLTPHA